MAKAVSQNSTTGNVQLPALLAGAPPLIEAAECVAFEMMRAIPPGCVPLKIDDHSCEPHIRYGEYAVIDPHQREVAWGGAFAVMSGTGPYIVRVVREPTQWAAHRPDAARRPAAYLTPLLPHTAEELDRCFKSGTAPRYGFRMSDGPIYVDGLQPLIIGRVVGVWKRAAARVA